MKAWSEPRPKPRRVSVAHFTAAVVRAGVEEHVLTLVRGLERKYFRPYVVCGPEVAEALKANLPDDVEVELLALGKLGSAAAAARLAQFLRTRQIDILHSHQFRASLLASPVGWACRVPVIVETPHLREAWRKGWLKGSFVVDRLVGRCVDYYIAVSEANARYLQEEKRLPSRKMAVIRNGIDLSRFDPCHVEPLGMRDRLGFQDDDPVLVVLARLEPQKGHHHLLEALPRVLREFPKVRVVCVGEGALRSELEQHARTRGLQASARFVGYQRNPADWLALADFTVLPSHFEGLPIVAIESLAMGKTMVATRVDGTPEVVLDGKTGLTVAPGDPGALAEAICWLLREPGLRQRLGQAGRQWVLEHFSQEQQIRKTQELYLRGLGALLPAERKGSAFLARHAQEQGNNKAFRLGSRPGSHGLSALQEPEPQVTPLSSNGQDSIHTCKGSGPSCSESASPGEFAALGAVVRDKTAELCARVYARSLRALVLTGSLARDEATWVRDGGQWKLLGDAEFFLVFDRDARLPGSESVESLEREVEEGLAKCGIAGHIQLAPVRPQYLRRLRPHIFAYELRACGRVVWGEPDILSLIPSFTAADIPLEDAWRLLANRMVEQLEATAGIKTFAGNAPERLRYLTVKLYLDMATSLLLFAGTYAPAYRERQRRLRVLADAETDESWPFPLGPFAERVSVSTDIKLGGEWGSSTEAEWDLWRQGLQYARLLWCWELARLAQGPPGATDRQLMRTWMRRQSFAGRLRGWMFVWRACGWLRSWRWWLHWARLAAEGPPRYWVYSAAHSLFCQLPEVVDDGTVRDSLGKDVLHRLPLVRRPEEAKSPLHWADLVGDVAWNYHRFLEPTRA